MAAAPAAMAANHAVTGKITILDKHGAPKAEHAGVVVFLDELDAPPAPLPAPARAVIRQVEKQFVPDVLPVMVGTTVDFPNGDAVFHNVFSLSKAKPFDLGIYEQGGSRSVTFDRTGLVKVYCNIHPQMIANVLVLGNPYFATTDHEGRFTIPDAPPGGATLRAWSARSREQPRRRIQITAQGVEHADLSLMEQLQLEIHEETISVEHTNKWGQDYPAKY